MIAFSTDTGAFRAYALAATAIATLLIVLALTTGFFRVRSKKYTRPEDAAAAKGELVTEEVEIVQLLRGAHANLIENALPFFVVGALFVATGPSATSANVYFGTFVGARFVHAIVYLARKQPYRSIAFTIGALDTLGMAAHVLKAAL